MLTAPARKLTYTETLRRRADHVAKIDAHVLSGKLDLAQYHAGALAQLDATERDVRAPATITALRADTWCVMCDRKLLAGSVRLYVNSKGSDLHFCTAACRWGKA